MTVTVPLVVAPTVGSSAEVAVTLNETSPADAFPGGVIVRSTVRVFGSPGGNVTLDGEKAPEKPLGKAPERLYVVVCSPVFVTTTRNVTGVRGPATALVGLSARNTFSVGKATVGKTFNWPSAESVPPSLVWALTTNPRGPSSTEGDAETCSGTVTVWPAATVTLAARSVENSSNPCVDSV